MGVRKNLLTKQRHLVKCKKENLFELDTKSILHHSRVVIKDMYYWTCPYSKARTCITGCYLTLQ